MKQLIIICLAATTVSVLGSFDQDGGYAKHFKYGLPTIIDLGEHVDHLNVEYPSGFNSGYGFIPGLHIPEESFNIELPKESEIYSLSDGISNLYEQNLLAPQLPNLIPQIKTSIKYTKSPTDTYEVKEEINEPIPVPNVNTLTSTFPALPSKSQNVQQTQGTPVSLGSGSLGVAQLINGKFAIGSGSLGYANSNNAQQPQQIQSQTSSLTNNFGNKPAARSLFDLFNLFKG